MTARDLALINVLIYYDPPKSMLKRVGCCLTAGMMARELLSDPPDCADEGISALNLVISSRPVSESLITRYINHNDTNGFVAFALKSSGGENILAFRGSESRPGCAVNNVDWVDNFTAPFSSSIQYADVERFVNLYPGEKAVCTGHSKGGHNAMYAAAVSQNPQNACICFDAQGFSLNQLSKQQKARLAANAVNYVYRRDIVGALLCHPEKRVFVKGSRDYNPHSLSAIAFDLPGSPISSRQAIFQRLISFATCTLPLPLPAFDTGMRSAE